MFMSFDLSFFVVIVDGAVAVFVVVVFDRLVIAFVVIVVLGVVVVHVVNTLIQMRCYCS